MTVSLRAGELRMLQVMARHHPMRMTRAQLGQLSRFTPRGGTFNTYLGTLRRHGFVHLDNGELRITSAGFAQLGENAPAPVTSTDQLLSTWRAVLRAGERRMLDELVRIHPKQLTRSELADRARFTPSGGTFNTYLGTLRRNHLVDVRGNAVRASDSLFLPMAAQAR